MLRTQERESHMSQTTPPIRDFARRLIAHDALRNKAVGKNAPPAFQVLAKLCLHLEALIGAIGLRALLSRTLVLTRDEFPGLRTMKANVYIDGTRDGWELLKAQFAPANLPAAQVVLLAQLLDLLVDFIGAGLTAQMVAEIWPKFSFEKMELATKDTYEKAN